MQRKTDIHLINEVLDPAVSQQCQDTSGTHRLLSGCHPRVPLPVPWELVAFLRYTAFPTLKIEALCTALLDLSSQKKHHIKKKNLFSLPVSMSWRYRLQKYRELLTQKGYRERSTLPSYGKKSRRFPYSTSFSDAKFLPHISFMIWELSLNKTPRFSLILNQRIR